MQVELQCPQCTCRFTLQPDTPAGKALDRITEHDPWYALGDGETFEDSLYSALTECGPVRCPECDAAVPVSEESLGDMALEVLTHW